MRFRYLTTQCLLISVTTLALAGCGGHAAEESGQSARQVEAEGEVIPVQGDPARATYQLLEWSRQANGHRVATTRRDGASGTSYARREIDCQKMQHRYLGEGDTRAEAEEDYSSANPMACLAPLVRRLAVLSAQSSDKPVYPAIDMPAYLAGRVVSSCAEGGMDMRKSDVEVLVGQGVRCGH